jgi:hypothetical protein
VLPHFGAAAALGLTVASSRRREVTDVHRNIEIILGRLLTDEAFRRAFLRDPDGTLERTAWSGLALTAGERHAVLATDRSLWARASGEIDSRLKKAA